MNGVSLVGGIMVCFVPKRILGYWSESLVGRTSAAECVELVMNAVQLGFAAASCLMHLQQKL